jgi:hypothetical protein
MEVNCVFGVQMRATPSTPAIQNGTSTCAQLGRSLSNINSISSQFLASTAGSGISFVSSDTGLTTNVIAVTSGNVFGFSAEL